jgi:hypothetical protein
VAAIGGQRTSISQNGENKKKVLKIKESIY